MKFGMVLLIVGLAVAAVGAVLLLAPRAFSWFGHLPGDIRVEGEHGGIYAPIGSMIVVSIVLTVVVNLVAWVIRRL